MHHTSSKLTKATQRWQASGLAAPSLLKDRLPMLSEINRRTDLTDTERRIMIYLMLDRINSETGLCCATEQHIADALGVTVRAIKKCKASLKAKNLLDWDTERLNGKNQICLYRFRYKVRGNGCSPLTGTPVPHKTGSTGTPVPHKTGTGVPHETVNHYLAKTGSPEWEAWHHYSRLTGKQYAPSTRHGGWWVPSQWPPSVQMDLADYLAT